MDPFGAAHHQPLGGGAAAAPSGFFSQSFESFSHGTGSRSFSSSTVISNGRAKTQSVKRYTDEHGQVHEERNEYEGAARDLPSMSYLGDGPAADRYGPPPARGYGAPRSLPAPRQHTRY